MTNTDAVTTAIEQMEAWIAEITEQKIANSESVLFELPKLVRHETLLELWRIVARTPSQAEGYGLAGAAAIEMLCERGDGSELDRFRREVRRQAARTWLRACKHLIKREYIDFAL